MKETMMEWIGISLSSLFVLLFVCLCYVAAKRWKQRTEECDDAEERESRQYEEMNALGNLSLALFESVTHHLGVVNNGLKQAEIDLDEGAIVPFWDSIERAIMAPGRFYEGIRGIDSNVSAYCRLVKEYESTAPPFPLARQSVGRLNDAGTATAQRMQAIVRKAHRNPHFAMVYEQRRTNQILVAGFTNLAQALDGMTWTITDSINRLGSSVDGMATVMHESAQATHSRMGEIRQDFSSEASQRAAREQKALEMLDNIQRGRRPFP